MKSVPIAAQPLERYRSIVGDAVMEEHLAIAEAARRRFFGRVIWNVSSTAVGGGVAEMLRALLPYVRGSGIDMMWFVLGGNDDFFRVTKRIHHALHGSAGDGSALDDGARALYEGALAGELAQFVPLVRRRDVVILHDPQTAGMVPALLEQGAHVVWRCHIGQDFANAETEAGWAFIGPYVSQAHATVFSRRTFIHPCCDGGRAVVIHPSIDPFSPKNQELGAGVERAILATAGLVSGASADVPPLFTREDGSPGRVLRAAELAGGGAAPPVEAPLVVQVSRWDGLKDPVGVIRGFAELVEREPAHDAHLMLAGPDSRAVADDPEGLETFASVVAVHEVLPAALRSRVHLASLPMDDPEENAALVNALQRHATIVVQKSLAEGFGLTVTEAMAKGRPVVASAVGGILEQIRDGHDGRLLMDPRDPGLFATVVGGLLADPAEAGRLGAAGRQRALEEFTGLRALREYAALLARVDSQNGVKAPAPEGLRARARAAVHRIRSGRRR